MKEMRTQEADRLNTMEVALGEKENELIELRHRLELFEKGMYGLQDALTEINDLKVQKSIRDSNIVELTKQLNEASRLAQDTFDENQAFRKKLGMSDVDTVNLGPIHRQRDLEFQQTKAMNIAYRAEIDRLEEERLHLKSQVRLRALEKGERAVQLGLTSDDLAAVEDFADRLRKGEKDATPKNQLPLKPALGDGVLDRITTDLERVHHELRITREERYTVETRMQLLLEENSSLKQALQEVSQSFLDSATVMDTKGATDTNQRKDSPLLHVSNLVNLLSNKQISAPPAPGTVSDITQPLRENFTQVNAIMRRELNVMKEKLASASGSLRKKDETIRQLETSIAHQQEIVAHKEKELLALQNFNLADASVVGTTSANLENGAAFLDQLVECLHDCSTKDAELTSIRELLECSNRDVKDVAQQLQLLFVDFRRTASRSEAETSKLKKANYDLQIQLECQTVKNTELQTLVESIRSVSSATDGLADAQAKIVELSRKHTVLKVNEKALSRRVLALTDSESTLKAQCTKLQDDLKSLDMASQQLILRLQRNLDIKRERFNQLEREAIHSVPLADYQLLESKFESLRVKYERKLSDVVEQAPAISDVMELKLEVNKWKLEAKNLESNIDDIHSRNSHLENLRRHLETVDSSTVDNTVSDTSFKDALSKMTKLRITSDGAVSKANFLEQKCSSLEQNEILLRQQLKDVETITSTLQDEVVSLRESESTLREAVHGSSTKEDSDARKAEIRRLNEEVAQLRADATRYRELASVAADQVKDLAVLRSTHEKESDILKAALEEIQMQGDDKLTIGKLHRQILSLQASEANAFHTLEKEVSRNRKLEALLLSAEKAATEREQLLWNVRLDNKAKVQDLQRRFSSWKEKYAIVPNESKGTVANIEKMVRASQILQSKYLDLAKQSSDSATEKQNLEEANADLAMKISILTETQEALKSDGSKISQKVMQWQQKLMETRSNELRLQRENLNKQERVRQLESLNKEYDARIQELEATLLETQVYYWLNGIVYLTIRRSRRNNPFYGIIGNWNWRDVLWDLNEIATAPFKRPRRRCRRSQLFIKDRMIIQVRPCRFQSS